MDPPPVQRCSDAMLIAKGINKSFGNINVLKDVKISVGMSKTVVIIGRSGSGKSTLLRCLGLLEYPDTGTVFLDREAIYTGDRSPNLLTREFKLAQYRTDLAMVFQRFNLFPHLNVLDNVTIGPREVLALAPDDAEARAREELSHVGLA